MRTGRKATRIASLLVGLATVSTGLWGISSSANALGNENLADSDSATRNVFSPTPAGNLTETTTNPTTLTLPAQHPGNENLSVKINDLKPRVLSSENTLVVEGTVFVKEATPLLNLVVRVSPNTALNAEQLKNYLAEKTPAGQWVAQTQLTDLPPQKPTSFKIEIPKAALPLGNAWDWGPRGIEVAAASNSIQATDRSLIIWDSQVEIAPSRIHAVGTVPVQTQVSEEKIETQLPTAADWKYPLEAARIPGVTLAVPADILKSDFGQTQLANTASELIALPNGSPDVVAISKLAHTTDLLTHLRNQVNESDFGKLPVRTDVVVPLLPKPDSQLERSLFPSKQQLIDAAVLTQWKGKTILAGELQLESPWSYNYSPSTYAFYTADGEISSTSSADGGLLLTSKQTLNEVFNRKITGADELLDDTQYLKAVSAVLTRERPFQPRSFLTLLPASGWDEVQLARLQALLQNRWVETSKDFYSSKDVAEPVPLRVLAQSALNPVVTVKQADLNALDSALNKAMPMAKAISAQAQLQEEYLLAKQNLFSESALIDSQLQTKVVKGFTGQMEKFTHLIKVAQPSTFNLVDKNATLPLRIINESSTEAVVNVKLQPSDPRLQIDDVVTVKIRGKSQQTVEFPVKAIGTGDVEVQVIVTANDGTEINKDMKFMVRVRADWESNATVVFIVIVCVIFIFGVFRTFRRNRQKPKELQVSSENPVSEAKNE
ncbi:DUF6049 family protein [Gleimia sp. 6138-11-ORH1]|uniref:DUF6049 family protein n=1 Tax=Gleimia sp. 6138-11-ORH1 TaxID=2973937 RepID=UPI002169CEB7|nr:DUF6049 family protein [Gleimia sp. 6138-11-ORH1]MCS4485146.1 DUF6049 family protein [Gleimia sp. 6138-11-ORH1]